jgi:hypothetical protein
VLVILKYAAGCVQVAVITPLTVVALAAKVEPAAWNGVGILIV